MASQLQTPSHAFGGGTTSLFDSDKPSGGGGGSSTSPQPATWYRYWNEQYNRYFYWQENNSISTWDLPPDGDTVVDYTTKEVVSGPDSITTAASATATMSPDVWRSAATPEQSVSQPAYAEEVPNNQGVLDRYDAASSTAAAAAALFGPGPSATAAASVDFDALTRGSMQGTGGMPTFDSSAAVDSLSWLQKSVSPVNHHQQQPNSSSLNSQVDSLFPTLMRTTLDEIDGGGRPRQQQPNGGMFRIPDGYQESIGLFPSIGMSEDRASMAPFGRMSATSLQRHRSQQQPSTAQQPRPTGMMRMSEPRRHEQRQQPQPTILDKKVQEEHDRLIAERMQAELDREYEERLTEAPLPCEAAQHKQTKKDKKMGRMPKATKPIKLIGGGGPSGAWGASPSSMTPRGGERPTSGNGSNAEDELANEMAAHGIVLKKAKMKSHKSGGRQPKAIPVGRK